VLAGIDVDKSCSISFHVSKHAAQLFLGEAGVYFMTIKIIIIDNIEIANWPDGQREEIVLEPALCQS
jgi:hypothetical protein